MSIKTKTIPQITERIQNPTDTNNGAPRVLVDSNILGVKKLFNAFPSSGLVNIIPKAVASYFPLNQKETILACAVIRDSDAIPNNILPIRSIK